MDESQKVTQENSKPDKSDLIASKAKSKKSVKSASSKFKSKSDESGEEVDAK